MTLLSGVWLHASGPLKVHIEHFILLSFEDIGVFVCSGFIQISQVQVPNCLGITYIHLFACLFLGTSDMS